MRDQDKPFVLYRQSRFNFTIIPRGVQGWTQFAVWMALLVPPTLAFVAYAEAHENDPGFVIAVALFMLATLVWTLGGIWWMKARAEVVDVEELLRLKHEAERRKCGGR